MRLLVVPIRSDDASGPQMRCDCIARPRYEVSAAPSLRARVRHSHDQDHAERERHHECARSFAIAIGQEGYDRHRSQKRCDQGHVDRDGVRNFSAPARSPRFAIAIAASSVIAENRPRIRRAARASQAPQPVHSQPREIESAGIAGRIYDPSFARGIEKNTKITRNQMTRNLSADRCDASSPRLRRAHSPAQRHEKKPWPDASDHDGEEEPWPPSVLGILEIALDMLVHEEEMQEARIAIRRQRQTMAPRSRSKSRLRVSMASRAISRPRRSIKSQISAIAPHRTGATGPFGQRAEREHCRRMRGTIGVHLAAEITRARREVKCAER